jgi:orotate phosphoribosyltransferase
MEDRALLEMLTAQVKRGEFRLASGRTSKYYLDAREVTMTARGAMKAAMAIMRQIRAEYKTIHAIGGPATAAVPIVGACLAVALHWELDDLTGFYVLGAAKEHGTGKRIHGPLNRGATVILIDDVATSGGSLLEAARVVREFDCKVDTAFCLVDRLEGAREALALEGITLKPLYTIRQLGVPYEGES